MKKGMWGKVYGEDHPYHKLTAAQVLEMRELYESDSGWTYKALAGKYGVSIRCVSQIMDGSSWKSVTGGIPVSEERRISGRIMSNSKLTKDDVVAIYKEYMTNKDSVQEELAKRYGVGQSVISSIVTGRTWSKVTRAIEVTGNGN